MTILLSNHISMRLIESLKRLLATPKNMVITVHQRPDADALGTSLGLAAFLKKYHHQVHIITPTAYPNYLNWLPGIAEIIVYKEERQEEAHALVNNAHIIFCIDFPVLTRLNDMAPIVSSASATKVVIDHHTVGNTPEFGDLVFRDERASATAELMYTIIKKMGAVAQIDREIATCLYVGIVTDTGSFKYANTTAETHITAGALVHYGINVNTISDKLYASTPKYKLKFLGFALSNRLVVRETYRAAYFYITAQDYAAYDLQAGDTEDLVNHALSIKGIVLAATIKEKPDGIRISLRSSGNIPVNKWAEEYFSGGGHKNAAGGRTNLTLKATIAMFEGLMRLKHEWLVGS